MQQNIFIFSRKSRYNIRYDYVSYMWYRCHLLFFKSLIFSGRKLWAFNFFSSLKYELKVRENGDPFWLFLIAAMKIIPDMMLFPRKLGGRKQGVPMPIVEWKQYSYVIKWTIKLLRKKFRRVTLLNASEIIISSIFNRGLAIEQRMSIYKEGLAARHLLRLFKR